MSLISCPECNKEISDTSSKCIHCGYQLKKKKPVKKIMVVTGSVMVILAAVVLLVLKLCQPDPIFPTFIELMECRSPETVKDILGGDFSHNDYESGFAFDNYRDIEIDGLGCPLFSIDYESGKCTGISYETQEIDQGTKDTFFEAMVDRFGDVQGYQTEKYADITSEQFHWKGKEDFWVHINHSNEDEEGIYYIKVTVNWR